MNVLKEMGIQQWRRRTALPASVDNSLNEHSADRSTSANVNKAHVDLNQTGFSNTANGTGGSGSLKQALMGAVQKSDKPDSKEVKSDSVGEVSSRLESVNSTQGNSLPEQEKTLTNETGLTQEVFSSSSESSESSQASADKIRSEKEESLSKQTAQPSKAIAPLDISELLGSSEVEVETADFSDLETVSFTDDSTQPPFNEMVFDGPTEPIVDVELPALDWNGLQSMMETNEHCPSCGWGNGLLGSGNQVADWMFVVDAPNSREIEAKMFFAGRAGQLFEAMLLALGLDRDKVYCSSVFKCAPTDDLSITPQCDALMLRQIELVEPKVLVSFGEFSAQALLKSNSSLEVLRSSDQQCFRSQTKVVPTYSPQEMLDSPALKAKVWVDLKKAMRLIAS